MMVWGYRRPPLCVGESMAGRIQSNQHLFFKRGAFMLSCVSKEFHLVWFWCREVTGDIFSLSFILKA